MYFHVFILFVWDVLFEVASLGPFPSASIEHGINCLRVCFYIYKGAYANSIWLACSKIIWCPHSLGSWDLSVMQHWWLLDFIGGERRRCPCNSKQSGEGGRGNLHNSSQATEGHIMGFFLGQSHSASLPIMYVWCIKDFRLMIWGESRPGAWYDLNQRCASANQPHLWALSSVSLQSHIQWRLNCNPAPNTPPARWRGELRL